MNRNLIVIITVLILALGGYFFYTNTTLKSDISDAPSSVIQSPNKDETGTNITNIPARGYYTSYNETEFKVYADNARRVLFFYAAWCPTCRPADAEFKTKEAQIPDDVVLYRVDYDTEDALKEKYGITYQHTFVQVDENGNEITKWNGGGLTELQNNIK